MNTETKIRSEVGLTVHSGSCPGSMQPDVTIFPAAPKPAAGIKAFSFAKEANDTLALCPQGSDCADGGGLMRVFECEDGCGFRGCGACMAVHANEPHASDSEVALAMSRSIGGRW